MQIKKALGVLRQEAETYSQMEESHNTLHKTQTQVGCKKEVKTYGISKQSKVHFQLLYWVAM